MSNLLTDNRSLAVKKRAFSIWQQTPHKVAPQSTAVHTCQSCETEFTGNYCPRCGQSARIGRFSFKTAFMLFLDIWGMGNRGMFRSIRDLMLRPGYMIRDYIGGRQSAYFPPFKMFFILTTLSLLLSHGIDLSLEAQKAPEARQETVKETVEETVKEARKEGFTINGEKANSRFIAAMLRIPDVIGALEKKSPSIFAFMILVLISAPLYLFFRRCPAIPDLRYSEHLVALVYTSNMYTLYQMLATLIPINLIKLLAVVMIFIALKQFTGYSKRRLLGYISLTLLIFFVFITVMIAIGIAIIYLYAEGLPKS